MKHEFSEIIEEWRYALLTMEQSKNAEISALKTELSLLKERRAELIGEITRLEDSKTELLSLISETYNFSQAGSGNIPQWLETRVKIRQTLEKYGL